MATISGMTGFGRTEGASGGWSWVVEARSVNGRGLDVRFRGPPGFDALERLTREAAQARFQRGQVSVTVTARRIEAGTPVRVNVDLARRLLEAGEPWIAEGRVLRPSLDGLLGLRGVLEGESVEEDPLAFQDVGAKLGEALGRHAARHLRESRRRAQASDHRTARSGDSSSQALSSLARQPHRGAT
jgi:uncharacterized protein YicC (UPF0701 family)